MQISTEGLVLRQVKVGEADQILTILTPDHGLISVSARGSLRLKSRLFSGCGLFCYSEFGITMGRVNNFVDRAEIIKVFHNLSQSVEGMALAVYLAEIAIQLAPEPPESAELLRVLLNCLYMIGEQKRPIRQIKAIYEMRTMTLAGYMPGLLACEDCGKYDGGAFYLDEREGMLYCAACAEKHRKQPNLDEGALYAVRHICLSEMPKLFAFLLSDKSLSHLTSVSERYLLAHLEQRPKSLDFLNTVLE